VSGYTCPNGHSSASADYCDTCGAPIASADPVGGGPGGGGAHAVDPGRPGSSAIPGPGPSPRPGPGPGSGAGVANPPAEAGSTGAPGGVPGPKPCPHCGTDNADDALFCESCGFDFTTGTPPRPTEPPSSLDIDVNAGQAQAMSPAPPPVAPAIEPASVVEIWVDPDWHSAQESDVAAPSPGLPVVAPLTAQSVLVGRRSVSRGINPEVDCGSDIGVSRRHAQLTTDGQRWWVEDLQSANGTYVGPASGPLPTAPLPAGRHELADDDRIYVGAWTRLVVRDATPEERAGTA
jgi:hypothetical protein